MQRQDRHDPGLQSRMRCPVGRFILGFIVAIVIVIFVVAQCAQTLF